MQPDQPRGGPSGGDSSPLLRWLGGGAALIVAAVLITFAAGLVLLGDDGGDSGTPSATRDTTTLVGATTVRDAPGSGAATVATLPGETPVRIVGRSHDSVWLVVQALPPDTTVGWVARTAVAHPGDLRAFAIIGEDTDSADGAGGSDTDADAAAESSPDQPDLVIAGAVTHDNLLSVTVANIGAADIGGPIEVAVAGSEPHRVDVGKPLRPNDELTVVLEGEYVQLRAFVTLTVSGPAGSQEPTDNNSRALIIEPDAPNDLEIFDVSGGDGAPLVVHVRNNSPIPLTGELTIAVRDDHGAGARLARIDAPLALDRQAVHRYPIEALTDVDLTRVQVLLSTGAIADASALNDVYPR